MVEEVNNINRSSEGREYIRESLNLLMDLSPSNLASLRGTLMQSSLQSLQECYMTGHLEGIQRVSVSVEKLEEALGLEWGSLNWNHVMGKDEEGEGNLAFFYPIGLILESVLPNNLVVLGKRGYHHYGDDVYIDFDVTKV